MKIIHTVREMQSISEDLRRKGNRIGFVPTMGFLHEGHLSLVRLARERGDIVVVSIFVNPTQFGPAEDLDAYPSDFERDEDLASGAVADILFYPSVQEMYPDGFRTFVNVEQLTEGLCGPSRPEHFRGVTTVCTKLFNAVKPHFAVFGQKDAQQSVVIRKMVKDLDLDLEIVIGPIVRETDGLAMSSRNAYLSADERKDAAVLYESLGLARDMIKEGERKAEIVLRRVREHINSKPGLRIDYIVLVDPDNLQDVETIQDDALIALAVYVGKTRLIDNVVVNV